MRIPLATLLGATLLLGCLGPASAAAPAPQYAFSDIAASPHAGAINFLASQGFVGGDSGLGGTFRPEAPITRAEFAKLAALLAGLAADAGKLADQPPGFADGAAIPRWAWGYVNADRAKGLIYGYPDGAFRPDGAVTLVEAATVMLRLAGLVPAVQGVWPDAEAAAAARYGITADLPAGADMGSPATRGQVAAIAYEAYARAPTGQITAAGAFSDDNPPLIYARPASPAFLTCTGVARGSTSDAGIVLGQPLADCDLPQAGGTASADFASQVWLNGARDTAQLAGATVLVTTDASGAVNYVEVLKPAAAPPSVSPVGHRMIVAEVTGTGLDGQGNYTVSVNFGGATLSYLLASQADQAGIRAILAGSQSGDPFVVVNTTPTNFSDAVFAGGSLYGGASTGTGLDQDGRVEFQNGHVAGLTPLAAIFNLAPQAGAGCSAGSVAVAVYCSDVYRVSAVDPAAGAVTMQELDGVTGAPTGAQVSAYTAGGLAVFTQGNAAAGTVGSYIGLAGLSVGDRVSLWGGGTGSTGGVVLVDPGLPNGYYTPNSSTFGGGRLPVQVLGLVKLSS